MISDACCSGGLRELMVNDSALIETPLQVKKARQDFRPCGHW